MEMKRSSFVCLGESGGEDALVYQEIPGREGGEEFFLFFAPGAPRQEAFLRTMFREAVSASRLGSPLHYFARVMEQFELATSPAASPATELGNPLENALLLIQIRRGDDAFLLCNRDAALLHWNGETGSLAPLEAVPGIRELSLGGRSGQRDLFDRAPEDCFALHQFETSGFHTIALVPSRDFAERHAETLRNSIFFPSFEIPRETGLALPVERSFPVLHWRSGGTGGARPAAAARKTIPRRVPIAACAGAGLIVLALSILFRGGGDRAAVGESRSRLVAADAQRDTAPRPEPRDEDRSMTRAESRAGAPLSEAWKKAFPAPVTSSPRCEGETVYFGCRDGHLYAYGTDGELRWKYRASDGIGASPLVLNGRIVCADYRGELFCLALESGAPVWKLPLGAKVVSSPAGRDDVLYAATTDGRVVAVRSREGKRLWEKKIGASVRATPAAGKNYVVAATTDGSLVKLDSNGKILWKVVVGGEILSSPLAIEENGIVVVGAPNRSIQARSLATGEIVWKVAADSPVSGSATLEGGVIYVGTRSGSVYAVGLDGAERWRAGAGGTVLSKPAVAGGTVFVTTYGSHLVAFDAATGTVLGRYRADSAIYSSPAVDGGRVYFGSNGGVFVALWLVPTA
jgi:outer membrane protein assembly factor BamB